MTLPSANSERRKKKREKSGKDSMSRSNQSSRCSSSSASRETYAIFIVFSSHFFYVYAMCANNSTCTNFTITRNPSVCSNICHFGDSKADHVWTLFDRMKIKLTQFCEIQKFLKYFDHFVSTSPIDIIPSSLGHWSRWTREKIYIYFIAHCIYTTWKKKSDKSWNFLFSSF